MPGFRCPRSIASLDYLRSGIQTLKHRRAKLWATRDRHDKVNHLASAAAADCERQLAAPCPAGACRPTLRNLRRRVEEEKRDPVQRRRTCPMERSLRGREDGPYSPADLQFRSGTRRSAADGKCAPKRYLPSPPPPSLDANM